jgi:serine/threonine protein kinase
MIGKKFGSYEIVEEIGSGGMGTVYKAYDGKFRRHVALKTLNPAALTNRKIIERFLIETTAIAALEHKHILPVYDCGEEDRLPYLVMRYIPSGTLLTYITKNNLTFEKIQQVITQIASALDFAHSKHILHRDVKPSNILIDEYGDTYLSDFGLAKIFIGENKELTDSNLPIGSAAYMSPEQCRGDKHLTPAADIYSLGIVLFQMLTGTYPYDGETGDSIRYKQVNEPPPLLRNFRPDLNESIEAVILKAMAKNPNERFKSCGELALAFDKAIKDQPTQQQIVLSPHKPRLPEPTIQMTTDGGIESDNLPPAKQSRFPQWILGAALAVIVIGVLIAAIGSNAPPAPMPTNTAVVTLTPHVTAAVSPTFTDTPIPTSPPTSRPSSTIFPSRTPVIIVPPPSSTAAPIISPLITNDEYRQCKNSGNCDSTPGDFQAYNNVTNKSKPVVTVTLDMARAYCKYVGARLLTDQEWQAAAQNDAKNVLNMAKYQDGSVLVNAEWVENSKAGVLISMGWDGTTIKRDSHDESDYNGKNLGFRCVKSS